MLSRAATSRVRLVALALVAPVMILLPTSTAHAASTCHGLPATIEASEGFVSGTPGDDVIVVTGTVQGVEAKEGDDLVCLVDTQKLPGYRLQVHVDPGGGNDEVDASAAGANMSVALGPGADSFTGSAFDDYVTAGTGTSPPEGTPVADPGPYQVSTGSGRDGLAVRAGATVDADLGKGADVLVLNSAYAGPASQFDLGAGRDTAGFADNWDDPGAGDTSLQVDLTRDLVTWRGVTSTLRHAENISGAARRIVLLGDRGPNRLSAHGCDVVLKGAAGDDFLWLSSARYDMAPDIASCSRNSLRAFGNAGDDRLEGGRRHDVLIGGPGLDSAFGGPAGRDRCEAERTWGKGCEG
jgi:RTX calcium-binding nonapeptide repeat (4 copies)